MPAAIAMVMPLQWILSAHQWLGLGGFPDSPITEYLARATSALCVFYGGLVFMLATNVRNYLPIIRYQAIAMMILSALSAVVWVRIGLATKWAILDLAIGWSLLIPILFLSNRLKRARHAGKEIRDPSAMATLPNQESDVQSSP